MTTDTTTFNLRRIRLVLIALAIVSSVGSARAQEAGSPREDKTLAPYFVVKGDPGVITYPLRIHALT